MSDRELRSAGMLVAAATLAVGALITLSPAAPLPRAAAEPSTSPTTTSPTTTSPTTTSASPAESEFPSDDRGYLNSAARCDDGQTVMMFGRTSRSLVVVCVGPDGQLEYRGVRLSDQAGLTMAASRSADGAIVASNDDVTYSITPQTLLVSEGDTVLYRDSWSEYHKPGSPAGSTTASTTAAPSTTTTTPTTTIPTVSTTTVTLTPTG
jgi:hypothetical protein